MKMNHPSYILDNEDGGGILLENRPMVILAGWMGCKPSSLKRYASIYRLLGYNVVIRIPPPSMIVHAASNQLSDHSTRLERNASTTAQTMHQLSVDIIKEVQQSNCSALVLHVFSNGGCFLWEAINNVLTNNERYAGIRSKFAGIVYDSSPADFSSEGGPDLIYQALQYCSTPERLRLRLQFLHKRLMLGQKKALEQSQQRAFDFWHRMRNSSLLDLPSLYIFSKTDALTPFDPLRELVHHRQEKYGKDKVRFLIFDKSRHCSHILTDGKVYEKAIKDFLEYCNGDSRSKGCIDFETKETIELPHSRL